eukprot:1826552-Karenia_brevis.AAC.1
MFRVRSSEDGQRKDERRCSEEEEVIKMFGGTSDEDVLEWTLEMYWDVHLKTCGTDLSSVLGWT